MVIKTMSCVVKKKKYIAVDDGEETLSKQVKCCDGCGKYSSYYAELEGSVYNAKETGNTSPFKIYDYFRERFNTMSTCFQCGKIFCDTCMSSVKQCIIDMYDEDEDEDGHHRTIGSIYFCKDCWSQSSPERDEFLRLVYDYHKMEASLNDIREKIFDKYTELYGDA